MRPSSNPEDALPHGLQESATGRKLVLGVLADLGGARSDADSAGSSVPLRQRRMREIDRDNLDEVLAGLDMRWRGRLSGMRGRADDRMEIDLSFRRLEDFHPDRIVEEIPALGDVHALLAALDHPTGFAHAAAKVEEWLGLAETPAEGTGVPDGSTQRDPVQGASVLDAILNRQHAPPAESSDIDRLVRDIVAPHRLQIDARRQESLTAAANGILSLQVGSILHDPAFQSPESLWRGLRRRSGLPWRRPVCFEGSPAARTRCRAETFAMEEEKQGGHEALLWGSPALVVATVFAGAFASSGWRMNPAVSGARLERLPLHIYKRRRVHGSLTLCRNPDDGTDHGSLCPGGIAAAGESSRRGHHQFPEPADNLPGPAPLFIQDKVDGRA